MENKITGRDSQGAWRQDELFGGKPPVDFDSKWSAVQSIQLEE
jgi:hypothetical protein